MIEYTIKKIDTFHTYKCKTEKLTDVKNTIRFKLCGEFFINYKDSNDVSKIDDNDFQKIKSISLKQFVEKYSNLKGANTTTQLFFIEKNTNNTYQKYRVIWSKDFIEYEPPQKLFEKF
ncbi:hypothetical protein [Kordia sp.]|uniref:hypothetical protein n=1 Tax=Kordia sp. TaxID=1965332 RepID=UPI003B5BB414